MIAKTIVRNDAANRNMACVVATRQVVWPRGGWRRRDERVRRRESDRSERGEGAKVGGTTFD